MPIFDNIKNQFDKKTVVSAAAGTALVGVAAFLARKSGIGVLKTAANVAKEGKK